jgi:hypothetical protein
MLFLTGLLVIWPDNQSDGHISLSGGHFFPVRRLFQAECPVYICFFAKRGPILVEKARFYALLCFFHKSLSFYAFFMLA